jgi:hypothetical protein
MPPRTLEHVEHALAALARLQAVPRVTDGTRGGTRCSRYQ